MKKFRFIRSLTTEPVLNISLDEMLLRLVGKHIIKRSIRFYKNMDSVIVGRFQEEKLEVNLNYCRKEHIPIVKRFTGGGTVFHDLGNLNVAVALPNDELTSSYLLENMHLLSEAILSALNSFNIEGEIGPHQEILVSGKKISGCAAAKKYGGFLYHATLLMHSNLYRLNKSIDVMKISVSSKKYVHSNRAEVMNLYSIKKIPEEDLERAIFISVEKML